MTSYIAEEANSIIRKAKTNDVTKIAERFNISLWVRELDEDVKGFSLIDGFRKLICVNRNVCDYSRDYIIAHEIGHLVLHAQSRHIFMCKSANYTKRELEADLFASFLLLGDNEFNNLVSSGKSDSEIASRYHLKKITVKTRRTMI